MTTTATPTASGRFQKCSHCKHIVTRFAWNCGSCFRIFTYAA